MGLEPVFFEKIGDQKTSRDEMLKNLIKALKKNGWTYKNKTLMGFHVTRNPGPNLVHPRSMGISFLKTIP